MRILLLMFITTLLYACGDKSSLVEENKEHLFTSLQPKESNITFANNIRESDIDNWFTYEYYYNGGGVAIGDINNDGLADIYFTGNMDGDKLYLNKGNLEFEDITSSAIKLFDDGWNTGVTMADVNGDGYLDIYVCRAGVNKTSAQKANLLYVNNGDLTFTEQAAELGLADTSLTTQASFFDFDLDGDLDVYVMNFPDGFFSLDGKEAQLLFETNSNKSDHFYENTGEKFVNSSVKVGINNHAYGLGLSVGDLNDDGYPDVYVANDYEERDYMFMNYKGQFREEVASRTKHISNFGMGTDIADFNNDGYLDIIEMDMAFASHVRSKRNMKSMSSDKFWGLVKSGNHYQYMVNTLQLNNGNTTFSEIGQMAGIAKTDWSWGALLADLDHDGYKDIAITNGYRRDMKDRDIMSTLEEQSKEKGAQLTVTEAYQFMPETKISNYLFQNNKDLTFKNTTEDWGIDEAINSNGIAYGDLDNDGDLDLVINNIDRVASVYINTNNKNNNYLSVKLEGEGKNLFAVGARVKITTENGEQVQELFPTRGYQSSVDYVLNFGIGQSEKIQKIEVRWPNQKISVQENVEANQLVTINIKGAKAGKLSKKETDPLFAFAVKSIKIPVKHQENDFNDFDREILLPHMLSRLGPCIAVADINGDGLDDAFFGGAKGSLGQLIIQNPDNTFSPYPTPFNADINCEDVGAEFFDCDGDGDMDLYVASGGNDCEVNDKSLQDRLYLNDGKGNFTKSNSLPKMISSTKVVKPYDIDSDGDLDLFVGGRLTPGKYPFASRSYILENKSGIFSDVTEGFSADLMEVGMVTGAEFVDVDNDKDVDLVMVGEWMPLTIFKNEGGKYTKETLENTEGLWYSLAVSDIDNDGDVDLVAGNMGKNSKFKGSIEKPFNIYCNDFDKNGTYDIVLSKYEGDIHYPVRGKECTSQQMPFIKEKFPTFKEFAEADMENIYGDDLEKALHLEVKDLYSSIFINDGKGIFKQNHLPYGAQLSPNNSIIIDDINGDGNLDIVMAGNMYGAEIETVRYDAGRGVCLIGDGKGNFVSLRPDESGFFAWGNIKDMEKIKVGDKQVYILSVNNSFPATYELLKK